MESFDKIGQAIKDHPLVFAGIIGIVALYFLWPSSGSGGLSTTAAETQAISAASQANAALTATQVNANTEIALSHDQLSAYGIGAATAEAINGQNTASAVSEATLASQVLQGQTAAAVTNNTTDANAAVTINSNNNQTSLAGLVNTNATNLSALENTNWTNLTALANTNSWANAATMYADQTAQKLALIGASYGENIATQQANLDTSLQSSYNWNAALSALTGH